ncbi:MAG TPA: PAS domain S-box protein [Bacteroidia bacterium]|jgi:PAS domain S-box-containing protein|nr:PAS domain S-box protein [Bacteroidia bacterium]
MAVQKTDIDFQALFASIVNTTDDAILSKTLDGTITSWNKGAEKIFGYSAKEIIGRPVSVIFPAHLLNEEKVIMENIRMGKYVAHYETERIKKDGTIITVSLTVSPITDVAGNIVGASSISRDITKRKKEEAELAEKMVYIEKRTTELSEVLLKYTLMDFSQQISISEKGDEMDAIAVGLNTVGEELQSHIDQLKESEERIKASQKIFSTVFYKSPVLNAITDSSTGKFIEVNDNFIKFIGYSKEELLGKTSFELNLIPDVDHRNRIVESIKKDGYSHDVLLEMRTKNGELKWVFTSSHVVKINDSSSILSAMVDVTERKKAEDQLLAVNKELEAFSYSVSHDLRAPLRAINGYAQMLNEDYGSKFDDEGKRIIDTIRYNAARMGTLIDDLLSFSRLGRKEVHKTVINMNELIEVMQNEMDKSLINNAKIKVDKLHKVKADYGLLQHVMFNLLSNAIKYSSKEKNPLIEISSEEKGNEIIFSVKDNGAGFDMRYYDKLFGVFQRLHTQDEFEGTGVGLAIVQRIIGKHGGKVWAEGKVDEGATFYFSLNKT